MSANQLHLHQYLALGQDQRQLGQYHLWVPGETVVSHKLKMPAAARRKWAETLPWMLEDELIDEPGNLHFSLGRADAEDQVTALSVPREQMEQWRSLCESGAGKVTALLPDYLALPWEEGGLSLLIDGDRWLVRCGAVEGYAGDSAFVEAVLTAQLASRPNAPISYIGSKALMPGLAEGRGRHLADSLDWSFCDCPLEFNLLRGEYRQANSFKSLKSWWPTAAAAMLLVVLASGYAITNYSRLNDEIPLLQADLSATYRSLLGSAPPTNNFRSAAQGAIGFRENQYLATQSIPLSVLVELDTFLSGCNSCQIQSVIASDERVELVMSADEPVLDRLAAISGLNVNIDAVSETEVKVVVVPGGANDV